jgi:hypothetical protein
VSSLPEFLTDQREHGSVGEVEHRHAGCEDQERAAFEQDAKARGLVVFLLLFDGQPTRERAILRDHVNNMRPNHKADPGLSSTYAETRSLPRSRTASKEEAPVNRSGSISKNGLHDRAAACLGEPPAGTQTRIRARQGQSYISS